MCEFPLEAKVLNDVEKLRKDCSRLDYVLGKEYQFLKNVLSQEEVFKSNHLNSLSSYYAAMSFLWKDHKFFHRQAENPIVLRPKMLDNEYKKFIMDYMGNCPIEEPLHNKMKEFKIYRNKDAILRQKAFALMYSRYIDFPISVNIVKKYASPSFFSDTAAVFFDSYKAIHHSHITRKIHGYAHNLL